jgi:hypothetical protein
MLERELDHIALVLSLETFFLGFRAILNVQA